MERAYRVLQQLQKDGVMTSEAARITRPSNVNEARATFGAALRLAGLQSYKADAVTAQVCKTCNICTIENIQRCKEQFIHYILPSSQARKVYFKYLQTLCRLFAPGSWKLKAASGLDEVLGLSAGGATNHLPASHARRIHTLYIINELLVSLLELSRQDSKVRPRPTADEERKYAREALDSAKQCCLDIFEEAACITPGEAAKPKNALNDILSNWTQIVTQVFTKSDIDRLRKIAENADNRKHDPSLKNLDLTTHLLAQSAQKMRPALRNRHGVKDDPDAPWHLLPAANGLKLREERGYPLLSRALPHGGYQLVNGGKPVNEQTRKEAEGLLSEMLHCFDTHTKADEVQDIDALGNKVWKDPERPTRNYWGFTEEGLRKMKENKKMFNASAKGYADIPPPERPRYVRNSEVERARELAASRGRGGRGGGFRGRGGGGGYRGRGGY
ncbi:hypothetical protein CB0940_09022 [Cercospora beticola]|uniref:CID domain-containing protein n=1 Tax=Cercospora beticola TaxID=122368 RepID=A0A2G5HGF4_CERBT|nr:hypothetical protein CB0940_09022 [Cercospora beticola]PIA91618.1 hypothetical protein CB0940_09022 [Cercospora beticola]WPB06705.1 hypothetical protein RHO25_011364 [Cercospora beticola]